eukprot:TRINITY_DN2451_c1_g1_i2.p3 TRINITY_DN2451_c1_g1~~TRINITY_DN2451_c1_g1_i2.p3  ORF type:complete len:293 (+),score=164.66 TRINITY_DN2451_c1_g1_i2:92-970(+)
MPPKKQKQSSKSEQKAKQKIVEDKTFGLKNKNKSKSVQKFVHSVQANVKAMGGKDAKAKEMEREKKRLEKEEKKAKEAELAKMGYGKEQKKKEEVSAAAAAAAERGEYLWTADDFEEVEHDAARLEEQLEEEREALAGRTDLTPVNEKTFQKWWADKQKRLAKEREAERKKMVRQFKLTGGGISGRQLFEHDASIFVDDADAFDTIEKEEDEEWERAKREAEERQAQLAAGAAAGPAPGAAAGAAAAAGPARHADPAAAAAGAADAAAEDEALFDGEDLPDEDEDEEGDGEE